MSKTFKFTNFKVIAINAIFSLMVATLVLACSNTNDNQLEGEGQVSFSIGGSNGANPMAKTMGGASTLTISNVSVARLFITDTNDNMVFDGSIELDTFNDKYISKSVFLSTGDYKLTSFVLLDSNGDAKYGVPTSNSTYASLVSNPLPISFSISKDNLFNQVLEVTLIEEDALVSDFGLIRFKFNLIDFMSFGIYVFDYDDALISTLSPAISADLLITSNTKNVSKYLGAQLNTITIKDEGYDSNYLLTISKQGYETQTYNLTYDEITNYKQSPLIVSLAKDNTTSVTTYSVLTDTGITFAGNYPEGNNDDCTSNINASQDCNHGRDATHNDDSDGHAGFKYTKLDINGTALSSSAASWSCVKDEITGLIWEIKTDGGADDIHDKDNPYRWGGKTAIGKNHADKEGDYYDDWNTLLDGSNTNNFCGFSDWRVPTKEELRSIVNYGKTNPSIDTNYFANTQSDHYWSSSPHGRYYGDAWKLSFYNSSDDNSGVTRENYAYVRLVRGSSY